MDKVLVIPEAPLLSDELTVTVTLPLTLPPETGLVTRTDGAEVSAPGVVVVAEFATFTETGEDDCTLPAAS